MTGDPWLLVAQRHFQDMRQDAVGGERLGETTNTAGVGRIGRLKASVGAALHALRPHPADDLAATDEPAYEPAEDMVHAQPVRTRLHGLG